MTAQSGKPGDEAAALDATVRVVVVPVGRLVLRLVRVALRVGRCGLEN